MFTHVNPKLGIRTFSVVRAYSAPKSRRVRWAFASSTLAGLSIYVFSTRPVHNDAPTGDTFQPRRQLVKSGFSPLVWGSNLNHLIAPEQDTNECIKFPTYSPELFSNPLRDIAFSINHAACVDAAGNVYQWGDSFFGSESTEPRRPKLTLQGKNIISVAVTPSNIFALSMSGKVFVLSSSLQRLSIASPPKSIWNIFISNKPQPMFTILDTDSPLQPSEKFISLSAGSDHLLGLTSLGRTFAHPVTPLANWHGQLGLRKISIQDPADLSKRLPIELSLRMTREGSRKDDTSTSDTIHGELVPSNPVDDKTTGFCDRFFEVPALRGLDVQQAVAGDRTSFVVIRRDGRVLGWGANEYGQLGLGATVTLPSIAVPTEIVLNQYTERGTTSRCMNIAAGGDLTFFTVERVLPTSGSHIVDVLACGNGQWGGIGNASYSSVQGTPVKVKGISGVLEYDEDTKSPKPLRLHHISVAPGPAVTSTGMRSSPSGHAMAMLDTIPLSYLSPPRSINTDASGAPGRDVLAWGLNQHYQVGNGKRTSVNFPVFVQTGDGQRHEGRLMCKVNRQIVKDFNGISVGKMLVEQRAVTGPGMSVVYWRIVL